MSRSPLCCLLTVNLLVFTVDFSQRGTGLPLFPPHFSFPIGTRRRGLPSPPHNEKLFPEDITCVLLGPILCA